MSSEVTVLRQLEAPIVRECCASYVKRGFTILEASVICNRFRGTPMVKTLDQQLDELNKLTAAIEKEMVKPKGERDDYIVMDMIEKFRRLHEYIDNLR